MKLSKYDEYKAFRKWKYETHIQGFMLKQERQQVQAKIFEPIKSIQIKIEENRKAIQQFNQEVGQSYRRKYNYEKFVISSQEIDLQNMLKDKVFYNK